MKLPKYSPYEMGTIRNKRKLTAVTGESEQHPVCNNQLPDTTVPGIHDDLFTLVLEEVEGRVTNEMFQDFSRTKGRILCASSKLDESFLNS